MPRYTFSSPSILAITIAAAACAPPEPEGASGLPANEPGRRAAPAIPGEPPSIAGMISTARTVEVRGAPPGVPADRPVSSSDTLPQGPIIDSTHQMLVEERPSETAGSAKAWVTVRRGTPVLRATGATRVENPWDALMPGTRVRVWFTGPVRESYPVQADARIVVID